jgi:hypothetical protein
MSKVAKLAFEDMKEMILKLRKSMEIEHSKMVKRTHSFKTVVFERVIDTSENWVAGSTYVFTKESRRLNRELGL